MPDSNDDGKPDLTLVVDDQRVAVDGRRNPLSVALLFYIVTLGAIVSACLRSLVVSDDVTVQSLAFLIGFGIAIGFFGGVTIGAFYFKGFFASSIAAAVGVGVGGLAGALALVDGSNFEEISLTAFGGCWVLILMMLLATRFSKLNRSIQTTVDPS